MELSDCSTERILLGEVVRENYCSEIFRSEQLFEFSNALMLVLIKWVCIMAAHCCLI